LIDKDGNNSSVGNKNIYNAGEGLSKYYSYPIFKTVPALATTDGNENSSYVYYTEHTGWIKGNKFGLLGNTAYTGLRPEVFVDGANTYEPFKMSDGALYFAPCFEVNVASTVAGTHSTIIDYIAVNEYVVNINEEVVNIGTTYVEPPTDFPQTYVASGYAIETPAYFSYH
jgi:hypothetical protein